MRTLGIILSVTFLAACGKGKGGDPAGRGVQALVDDWGRAGLASSGFQPLEKAALGGKCQAGLVADLEVTVCEYSDAAAARGAEPAGLTLVGEATGLSLAAGTRLLVVADRKNADPGGRKTNQIAGIFAGPAPAAAASPLPARK